MEHILKDFLQPVVIIIGGIISVSGFIFACYQFKRQQRFKEIQNLSSIWKNFRTDNDVFDAFVLMDEIENEKGDITTLENLSPKIKLKYLAMLEEVMLYVTEIEVDNKIAHYLFQWHFFFVFQSNHTAKAFWKNIGTETEMNAEYWSKSRTLFAQGKS